MQADNHAGMDVDGEREPRPDHTEPVLSIDHEDVHGRVVDLDDVKRPRGDELSRDSDKILQSRRVVSFAGNTTTSVPLTRLLIVRQFGTGTLT